MSFRVALLSLAILTTLACADVHAQTQPQKASKAQSSAKPGKIDALTPAKKQAVDAFVDSLELAPNWPRFVEQSQQTFADDVRTGIVEGAELDRLPAEQRVKVDAVVDDMIPHILADMKVALLKVDAKALYHAIGYQVYGRHFSTRELKELTAIYNSPVYHRAMPLILEQRKHKPESTDDELRQLIGAADFDALAKSMQSPAYTKLLMRLPQTQATTNELIGVVVGDISEQVGKSYSTILLEKIRQIMNDAPEDQPENKPASVQTNAPTEPGKATQ